MLDKLYLVIAQAHGAAPEAAHKTVTAPFPEWITPVINTNVLNIAIAFAFLGWLIWKFNLFSGIDKTREKIVNNIQDALQTRDESLKLLKEAEESLKNARDEADTIIKAAEENAKQLKEQVINDARIEAEKIIEQAKKIADNERYAIKNELQHNLTVAAVEVAKDNIRKSLDENWHKQIIEEFVDNLSTIKVNNR